VSGVARNWAYRGAGGAGGRRTSAHRGVMLRGCSAVAVDRHRAATRSGTERNLDANMQRLGGARTVLFWGLQSRCFGVGVKY
jgi:hypothetical protein